MDPKHTLIDAGNFIFRSGVVCWVIADHIVVLVNKETGECSLPQAPCKWIPRSEFELDDLTTLESFDATANRIASQQMGFEAALQGYNITPSLQPGGLRCAGQTPNENPFLVDTFTSAKSGTTKITAWFLAETTLSGNWKVDTADFGEDWKVEAMLEYEAILRLPEHEADILAKANQAKEQNEARLRIQ
ncbi:hypothetical protein MMC13_005738 [Lambiella insularis]|nr:hypothetical protein [Lambiella insularis]